MITFLSNIGEWLAMNPIYNVWQEGTDGLMGNYRQRRLRDARGTCFRCGRTIKDEDAFERERGGTRWLLCVPSDANAMRGCE